MTIFLDSPLCQNAVLPDGGSEFARQYMHQDHDRYISMLRQFLSVNPAVHQIAPLAILPTDANIFLLFTRISQGSEVSDR